MRVVVSYIPSAIPNWQRLARQGHCGLIYLDNRDLGNTEHTVRYIHERPKDEGGKAVPLPLSLAIADVDARILQLIGRCNSDA